MTVEPGQWFESFAFQQFSVVPYHAVIIIVTLLTIVLGAHTIEKTNKIMMPLFFILFAALAVRMAFLPGAFVGIGVFMEPIAETKGAILGGWGAWMDLVSTYIIPIGAVLGAVSWFWVMKKDELLDEINTGAKKHYGNGWYYLGKYVYTLFALFLCVVALVRGEGF